MQSNKTNTGGFIEKEASRLSQLRLRRGECPECGDMPRDIEADPLTCTSCKHQWTLSSVKQASHFSHPENWDKVKDRSGHFVTFWTGQNDWEETTTWMWVTHVEESRALAQGHWIELKYPDNLPSPGDERAYKQRAELKQWAEAAEAAWASAAKAQAVKRKEYDTAEPDVQDYAAAAATDGMQKYVKSHGSMGNVKQASSPVGKFVDTRGMWQKSAALQRQAMTGPHGILQALKNLDLSQLKKEAEDNIRSGKVTRRDRGVKMLNAIVGLERNGTAPHELMISKVPVLPPQFRPFSAMGDTFIAGSANELYQDLFRHRSVHEETLRELGEEGAGLSRLNMYNAARALYGYGDPVSPKLKARGTQGYLYQLLGDKPKTSFFQRRLISKPIDSVGRGVITVDPDLGMNDISLPREMAWTLYDSHVQSRLVRNSGMKVSEAVRAIKNRTKEAQIALEQELKERPALYSRAPAWHKFNTVAGWVRLHDGNNIAVNPYVMAGLAADVDGDQINVNVPIMPESVKEAKEKLMPDKMIFSIRDPDVTMAQPKHEQVLGLWVPGARPSGNTFKFGSKQEALAAVRTGAVRYDDDLEFPDA